MSSLRRRHRSPAAPPPLEDDDLLSEILLRLPPHPSSLPRASAVCKRWRGLVTDPRFLRRFRLHHRRNPPLLGFFHKKCSGPILRSYSGGPQSCSSRALLLAARKPFQGPRMPPWPCINLRPESAPVPGVGPRHRPTTPPSHILEFDLGMGRLSVTRKPIRDMLEILCFTVMPAEGGGLGFLSMSGFTAQFWRRKTDSDGVASWEMVKTIELGRLLSLNSNSDKYVEIRGFAEDSNLVFLYTAVSLFIVQFESLQFKKLTKPERVGYSHPFESVYAAGI
ncbi:unnamed protein product [Alopecurus aequalis]